jgi:hypothetical protein
MSELSDTSTETPTAEQHRPIVRELDRSFASVYGYGGMAVLAFALVPVATAYLQGWLTQPGTWVVAITFALIGLYPLRGVVNRRREALAERFYAYCEVNDLDPATIVAYFQDAGDYPYFQSLVEERPGATASMDER